MKKVEWPDLMKPAAKTIIEWTYTPEDYFETEIDEDRVTFQLKVAHGKVTASFHGESYDSVQATIEKYHSEIRALFSAAQIVSHTPFTLSKYQLHRLHPDRGKDITVFPDPVTLRLASSTIDFVVTDSEGNIVSDSKANRIREKLEIAKLAATYSRADPTTRMMLSSYQAAVDDPSNELVHLYQIRDALKKKFGRRKAPSRLCMPEPDWEQFDALCNNEPLAQGRHRGQNADALRNATVDELNTARRIAKQMILSYLKWMDHQERNESCG